MAGTDSSAVTVDELAAYFGLVLYGHWKPSGLVDFAEILIALLIGTHVAWQLIQRKGTLPLRLRGPTDFKLTYYRSSAP